jgi:hypothetical protein
VFEQSDGRDESREQRFRTEATMNFVWSCDSQERKTAGGLAGQRAYRLPVHPLRL